jgi:hypothetical protein
MLVCAPEKVAVKGFFARSLRAVALRTPGARPRGGDQRLGRPLNTMPFAPVIKIQTIDAVEQ